MNYAICIFVILASAASRVIWIKIGICYLLRRQPCSLIMLNKTQTGDVI